MSSEIKGLETHFSVEEIADFLRVKRTYVMRMIWVGKLKAIPIGKKKLIPQSSLNAFLADCQKNNNDNSAVSEETLAKLKFNAGLRIQASSPKQLERLDADAQDLKEKIPGYDPLARVPKIAKLKSVVHAREDKRQKLANIPAVLNDLSETAYPGIMALTEVDPEAIEAQFVDIANEALNAQGAEEADGPMAQYAKDTLKETTPAANKPKAKVNTTTKKAVKATAKASGQLGKKVAAKSKATASK